MGRKVEEWQTSIANLDRICAGWTVKGEDLKDLFGDEYCVSLWNELIANADPEVYFRTTTALRLSFEPEKAKQESRLHEHSIAVVLDDSNAAMVGNNHCTAR